MACDAGSGNGHQTLPLHLDHRENAEIGLPGFEALCALGGHIEVQEEAVALRTMQKTPNQRNSIQVTDRGNRWFKGEVRTGVQPVSLPFRLFRSRCCARNPVFWCQEDEIHELA